MIEYSTIAGSIGAGGIGYVAVTYGYQRFDNGVMLATIIVLVLLVAAVQKIGDTLVFRTTPHARTRRSVQKSHLQPSHLQPSHLQPTP